MQTLTFDELGSLPCVISVETAAKALGISRTLAYQLAKQGNFPCQVIRIASTYRVATADLLRHLAVTRDGLGDPRSVPKRASG